MKSMGRTGAVVSVADQGVPGSRPDLCTVFCGLEHVTFTQEAVDGRLGLTAPRLETTFCWFTLIRDCLGHTLCILYLTKMVL